MFSLSRDPASSTMITLSLVLVGLTVLVKISSTLWIERLLSDKPREYSYVFNDHPEAWPIERPPVLMAFDNSLHYRIDTDDGAAEWSSTIPGDGLIHLGSERQPYTISMLHQLRCLDIVRAETIRDRDEEPNEGTALARHCMNYLRQMVTCRGDLELEPFQYASHKSPIDLYRTYECKDWGAVYAEVEKNQMEYREWQKSRSH